MSIALGLTALFSGAAGALSSAFVASFPKTAPNIRAAVISGTIVSSVFLAGGYSMLDNNECVTSTQQDTALIQDVSACYTRAPEGALVTIERGDDGRVNCAYVVPN